MKGFCSLLLVCALAACGGSPLKDDMSMPADVTQPQPSTNPAQSPNPGQSPDPQSPTPGDPTPVNPGPQLPDLELNLDRALIEAAIDADAPFQVNPVSLPVPDHGRLDNPAWVQEQKRPLNVPGYEGLTYVRDSDRLVIYNDSTTDAVPPPPLSQQDREYAQFGYWLLANTDSNGDVQSYQVHPYYGAPSGNVFLRYENVAAGSATYSGRAAGLYTTAQDAGQFYAGVHLTASYTGGSHPAVSGTVSQFRNESGSLIDGSWMLTFGQPSYDGRGRFSGSTAPSGQYQLGFYGLSEAVDDGTGNFVADLPAHAGGAFTGHFSNGNVRGSFGASIDE